MATKPTIVSLVLPALVLLAPPASAADRYKTNNNDNLDLTSSWTNALTPAGADVAVWDSTVAVPANCTNNLNVAKTWGGIRLLNPAAPVKISSASGSTLTLNSSGLDLNEPGTAQDLWLALPLAVAQAQTWSIKPGRTLSVGDTNPGLTLTISAGVTINGYVRFLNSINVQSGGSLTVPAGTTLEPAANAAPSTAFVLGANATSGNNVSQTGGAVKVQRGDGTTSNPKSSLSIGDVTGSCATYTISGGSLTDVTSSNSTCLMIGNSGTGTLNVSGTAAVQFWGLRMGNASSATGTLNLSNGAVTLTSTGGNSTFDVGRATAGGNGVLNVYGGALSSPISMNVAHGSGSGAFNLYGGNTYLDSLYVAHANGGPANVAIAGGTLIVTNSLTLLYGGAGNATVSLNGGTVIAPAVTRGSGTGVGALNLNGGILKPRAATTAFLANNLTVNIGTNGAWIDTAGNNINIPAPLLHGSGVTPDGGLTKLGAGTLTLSGSSTFNGTTVVTNGTLLVNNSAGSGTGTGSVIVCSNATLGGTGTISGPVTVNPNATLAPGVPGGTLTLGSAPTLNGTLAMVISKSGTNLSGSKLVLAGGANLTYGGSLLVTATGDPLAVGDTFDLFDAASFDGGFTATTLPAAPTGSFWDMSQLTVNGTIRAAPLPLAHPSFNPVALVDDTTLSLSGTGGPSSSAYYVLGSTNLAAPLTNWFLIASNAFEADGRFTFTATLDPDLSAQFFALSLSAPPPPPPPPGPSASDVVISNMLCNIRDNGFDPCRNINSGLGGLWINWRYGTSPLKVNFQSNGTTDPAIDCNATSDSPRHDELTDLRYVHNLLWYKNRHPADTNFDADLQRYTAIVQDEFTGTHNDRGWVYDEELIPIWQLSGDNFYKTNALGLISYYTNHWYHDPVRGIYDASKGTNGLGYYRSDLALEIGCALVHAGIVFTNAEWVREGTNCVEFLYQHAYLTNYNLFLRDMENILLTNGAANPNPTIYRNGDTDGGTIRISPIGQEALALLHVYLVATNQPFAQLYLNRAMKLLDGLDMNRNTLGLWDTVYGGYFGGLIFPGTVYPNVGTPSFINGTKEGGRQIDMLQAYHLANSVTTNRYATTEAALLDVAVNKTYYAPGHGVIYEVNNNWTPRVLSNGLEDWVTTEAMGIVTEALFSLGELYPW